MVHAPKHDTRHGTTGRDTTRAVTNKKSAAEYTNHATFRVAQHAHDSVLKSFKSAHKNQILESRKRVADENAKMYEYERKHRSRLQGTRQKQISTHQPRRLLPLPLVRPLTSLAPLSPLSQTPRRAGARRHLRLVAYSGSGADTLSTLARRCRRRSRYGCDAPSGVDGVCRGSESRLSAPRINITIIVASSLHRRRRW